jgi:hypothetical protein
MSGRAAGKRAYISIPSPDPDTHSLFSPPIINFQPSIDMADQE